MRLLTAVLLALGLTFATLAISTFTRADETPATCEMTLTSVQEQVAQSAGLTLKLFQSETEVTKLMAAYKEVIGEPPFDSDTIRTIARISFDIGPMNNIGFFDAAGCLISALRGIPTSRQEMIEELAFGRRA